MNDHLYQAQTAKSTETFARDFKEIASANGFTIANQDTMDMARTFAAHGAEVAETFDLHMIQLCKPDKAAASLQQNPERAVLMPKFVMAFSNGEQTQIRFHHYCEETIRNTVDCPTFPDSLAGTYRKIIDMIEASL